MIFVVKVGVIFIFLFIGCLDDINFDGMDLIEDICIVYDNYGYEI